MERPREASGAFVFLGYGKYVRADRIYALERLGPGDDRGDGRRTRVWVDGIPEALIAARTERTILADMDDAAAAAGAIRRRRSAQTSLFDA